MPYGNSQRAKKYRTFYVTVRNHQKKFSSMNAWSRLWQYYICNSCVADPFGMYNWAETHRWVIIWHNYRRCRHHHHHPHPPPPPPPHYYYYYCYYYYQHQHHFHSETTWQPYLKDFCSTFEELHPLVLNSG